MSQARIRTLYTVSIVVTDVTMTAAAFLIAYWLRLVVPLPDPTGSIDNFINYLPMMVVQIASVVLVFYVNKLYHVVRAQSRVDTVSQIFGAVSVGTMMAVAISALTFKNSILALDYPRAMILYAWLLAIVMVALGREIHRTIWQRLRAAGFGRDPVLVVGSGDSAKAIIRLIHWSPQLGYELVGVVDGVDTGQDIAGAKLVGTIADLASLVDDLDVREVIIAMPESTPQQEIVRIVNLCQRGSVAIKIFPDLFEFVTTEVTIDDLGGLPLLNVRDIQLRGWKLSLKRALDIFGASFGLIFLSPVMLLFAALIRIESPGEVFYCQERMGLDGKAFQMVKFRSMRHDAEKAGPGWTVKNDPRKTRLGKWLRARNIDELPQFINVLLGEMSLVGPRPERPVYVQEFRQSIPRYMERHREKAGMTGWAQVNGLRGDTSISERTKYDLWYVENWSLWLDLKILVRTVVGTLLGPPDATNAY